MGEVLTIEDAVRRRVASRVLSQTFVFTNGCFDILHPGHVELLRQAAILGHYLMVGINSDRSAQRLGKGAGRPVQDEHARATVLAALSVVDGVVIFEEETPLELIEMLRPNVLVKGGDYTPEQVVGREIVERDGGRVVIVPLVPGHSSSKIASSLR
ncbi:MAG TPA: adenylyltransferase/cytidyltransferase family protein [Candidatus Eisenbacteria bacterium]|nr:adenylyltransferase/cytidyltransferase family protein [Candidatus Eisenbacteria bacterium]